MNYELGAIQKLYDDKNILEIIVDRYDDVYWESDGKIHEANDLFKSDKEVEKVIENLLNAAGKTSEILEEGFADLRLSDGTRVAIAIAPININGPSFVIRKLPQKEVSAENIKDWNVLNDDGWKICQKLMQEGKRVIMAGNVGSGKTTMTNILISEIDKEWRVVTVEKTAELLTYERKRTLRLETPKAKQSEMRDLIAKAAMLRADTIVINELSGAETFDVINLMRSGYSIVATITSEGVQDALKKAELFCLMGKMGLGLQETQYHVASGIDAVIYQERLSNGKRVVSNIALVDGINDNGNYQTRPLFTYDEDSESFFVTPEGKKFIA